MLTAQDAPSLKTFDDVPGFLVPSKKNRRIFALERKDTRIRGSRSIPLESARQLVRDFAYAPTQIVLTFRVPFLEVDPLNFRSHPLFAQRRQQYRKDNLPQCARLRELGEAPLRIEPVRREQQQHQVAARYLLVEPPLPVLPNGQPGVLVEVEEDALVAFRSQPVLQFLRRHLVTARMADEDGGHLGCISALCEKPKSGLVVWGRPVFHSWRVPALHHAGDEALPRLNRLPGTWPANEGIWIQSIIAGARRDTKCQGS